MIDDYNQKGRTPVYYRRILNCMDEISRQILKESVNFEARYYTCSGPELVLPVTANSARPIQEGAVWGETRTYGYFFLQAHVPSKWEGKSLAAWLDFGGEALLYSSRGVPLCGLTNGSAFAEHYAKDVYHFPVPAHPSEQIVLCVEAVASSHLGLREPEPPAKRDDPFRHGHWQATVNKMRLCLFDHESWQLFLDMQFLLDLWEDLDRDSVRATRILKALFAVSCMWQGNQENSGQCRMILEREMKKPASASALSCAVTGHAHIDTAWLWQIKETRRKVARTFASQLDLLDRYPEYVFGASAPQHYQWLKEDFPDIFARVREQVQKGRWEVQGAMWIESDCNLVSGESLIRQLMHGKNFWKDEFNLEIRNCWIPDVFGYPASLPQILLKAGVDCFLTQKLSWSKFNEFPHDTFIWRGIDGSRILTHFPPEYTYNSYCRPQDLRKAEKTFHERDRLDEFLTLMGMGDGGGGAKDEHLEHLRRSQNAEGLPRAFPSRADSFFFRLAQHSHELDMWTGELYLEYHRGTYTSQGRIKQLNRLLEEDLRMVESLWSCLPLQDWPDQELNRVVKTMLLHQFHDILPGSSIHAVYQDAEVFCSEALGTLTRLRENALERLSNTCLPTEHSNAKGLTLFNCLSHEWSGTIELPSSSAGYSLIDSNQVTIPVQKDSAGYVAAVTVPGTCFSPYSFLDTGKPHSPVEPENGFLADEQAHVHALNSAQSDEYWCNYMCNDETIILENKFMRYTLSKGGNILSAVDRETGRPVLNTKHKSNVLSIYEDTPHNFEAWDIDFYYSEQLLENLFAVSFEPLGHGPVRAGIRFVYQTGKSNISQDVWLERNSAQMTFQTTVDWNEARRMLRVSFPLESNATEAICGIQFGHVSRPTIVNTEWDFARFEVCAHGWVDIPTRDGGVALLNDCKFGHNVRNNILDLCLLRSPLYPDPEADVGKHTFTYSLYPHREPLINSDVMEKAAQISRPVISYECVFTGKKMPLQISGKGILLSACKKAERENDLIVRLVEIRGVYTFAECTVDPLYGIYCETDAIEWTNSPSIPCSGKIVLEFTPFEIKTLRFRSC